MYIEFIYFTTMQKLQLNQSNLLLPPFYVHKIQFISHKLHPSSNSHGWLHELVFLFSHRGSHFLKHHTRLSIEPHGQSDLTILTWKNCGALLKKFIEIQGWLLLTFFICLHNQLSSFNSIVIQMYEKHDSSNRQ